MTDPHIAAHDPFGPQPHTDKTVEEMTRDELDEFLAWGKKETAYRCNPPLRLHLTSEQRDILIGLRQRLKDYAEDLDAEQDDAQDGDEDREQACDGRQYLYGLMDALSWVASGCYDGDLDRGISDLAEPLTGAGISRAQREADLAATH